MFNHGNSVAAVQIRSFYFRYQTPVSPEDVSGKQSTDFIKNILGCNLSKSSMQKILNKTLKYFFIKNIAFLLSKN